MIIIQQAGVEANILDVGEVDAMREDLWVSNDILNSQNTSHLVICGQ